MAFETVRWEKKEEQNPSCPAAAVSFGSAVPERLLLEVSRQDRRVQAMPMQSGPVRYLPTYLVFGQK